MLNGACGIIQARVTSTRLPGKVLKKLGGTTMLEYLINRLKGSSALKKIVTAVPDNLENRRLQDFLSERGCLSYAGSEENVLERYIGAAREYFAPYIVRITSDNPFTSPSFIDLMCGEFLKGGYDYAYVRDLPVGMGAEIVTLDALERIYRTSGDAYYTEHVTTYIKKHPGQFSIKEIMPGEKFRRRDLLMTVDTEDDYKKIFKAVETLGSDRFLPDAEIIEYFSRQALI